MNRLDPLDVVDSHTAGEPTRTVVGGIPESLDIAPATTADLTRVVARMSGSFDWIRTSLIAEPRGSDVMVGAILLPPPADAGDDCVGSVIFFNNVGYLGMCGHGMIGVVTTLAWLGKIQPGQYQLATPVGNVNATLGSDGRVTIENVASYRYRAAVPVSLAGGRVVHGDIAWGGNWFYLCQDHGLEIRTAHIDELTSLSLEIRRCLDAAGIRGERDELIDHVELVTTVSDDSSSDSFRNFVLCPGLAYDRSPCGTGTSAKVACLAADGKLATGASVRVIGISGEAFEASYGEDSSRSAGRVIPRVTGKAYVNGRSQIMFDTNDPFRFGIV